MIILNFECWLIAFGNAKQQKYFKTVSNLHRYKYHVLLFICVNQSSEDTMTSKELIQSSPSRRMWFICYANATHNLLMNANRRWQRSTQNLSVLCALSVPVLALAAVLAPQFCSPLGAEHPSMLFPVEVQILLTESQNPKMLGIGRDLKGLSSPIPPLEAEHLGEVTK